MAPSRRRFEQPSAVVGDSILAALGAMEDEEEPHRSMTQTVKKRQSGFRNTSTITETVVSVRSSSSSSSSFSSGVSEETAGGDGVTESDVGSKDSLEESEEERVSDADSCVASFRGDPRTAEGFDGDDNASNSDEGEEYGLDGDESDFDPEEVSEDEEDDDESVLEEVEDADEIYAARLQKNNGSGTTGANNSSVMGTNKDDANLIFSDDDEETFSPYSSNGSSHDSPDGDSHEIESLDANNWIGKAPQEGSTIAVDKTDESFGGGGDNFSCDSVNRSVDPQVLETLSYSEEENEQKDGGPIGARVALSPMSSHLYPPIVQITTVAGRADTDFVSPLGTSLQRASRLSRKHSVVDEDVVVAVIVDDSDDESSEIEAVVAEILGSDDEDDETVLQSPNLSPRSASTSPSADFVSDGKESKNSSKQNDMADAAHGTSSQIAVRASPAKRNNVTCTSIAQDNKSNGKSPKQSPTNRNLSSSFSKQLMAGEDGIFRDNGAFVSSPSEKTLLSEKANFSSGGQDLLSSSMAAEMASKSLLQTIASPFHCPDERELPELFDSKDSRLATFHESNFLSAETDSAVTSGPTSDVEYATPISEADASLKHDDKEAHRSADETPLLPREQPSLACTVGRLSDAESGSEAALVQTASCSVSESVDVVDSFASNDIKALGQVCGIRYDLHHCSECDSGSIHLPRDPSPGADIICAATGSVELSEVILKADYLCSGSVGTNCPTSAGDFQDVLPPQLRSLADIKGRKRKEVKFLFPDATTGENLASLESGKENSRIFATTVLPDAKIVAQQRRENQRAGGVRREGSIKRGQWKLGSKIGSGAFGVVHIGMNTETGKLMAVKSLRMEAAVMNDAKREVQLLKSLEHINIVRYYGAEMDSKYLHIFQEWIPGGSVASLLAKFGPFPIYVLRSYLGQTITGLEYLHNNNILHRDIKGSNILVNDEGIVKLADFGAGKHLGEWQTDMMLSMTMRGTPYFMAPEVFEEKYSCKADIWSVGCVAFQMATGTPPWKALGCTNPVSLFQRISKLNGPPAMDINESEAVCGVREGRKILELFKNVVASCFQRDPEKRPAAHELLRDVFFSFEASPMVDDDAETSFLFSPLSAPKTNNRASPFRTIMSPMSPVIRRRRNSFDASRSPFHSPPLPRSSITRSCRPPLSPQPDASDWPTWAREKLRTDTIEDVCVSQSVALNSDSLAYSASTRSTMAGSAPLTGLDFVTSISSPLTKIDRSVKRDS